MYFSTVVTAFGISMMLPMLVHVDNHGGNMNKPAKLAAVCGIIVATMSSAQAIPIYTTADATADGRITQYLIQFSNLRRVQ
jgi:hypothetical protein